MLLPESGQSVPFDELLHYRWSINGSPITGKNATLGKLIERAKIVLNPARPAMTVIGHGDAHFGNVFLEQQRDYRYFDPAFAGRHSVLLDIVKPFFHNVYATWMYFPDEVVRDLRLSVVLRGDQVLIEHNYEVSPLRRALLQTKLEHLLQPLKALLHAQDVLADDWYEVITLALLCCPLLTINLLDRQRIPPTICWLGLSQAMQMGSLFLGE